MKKLLSMFMAITTLSLYFSVTAYGEYKTPFDINAESVYLVNTDTNEVILDINSHKKVNPADLTKLMTAIIIVENCPVELSQANVTMKPYVQDYMYLKNRERRINLGGFLSGETITMDKLLYAILLPRANEAAMMAADYVGDGSVDYFAEMMNEKAKELGAVNTYFTNSHGLYDEKQYTTAYDMYLISKYAMENPIIAQVLSTISYEGGPTNKHQSLLWHNANKLIVKTSPSYYQFVKAGMPSYADIGQYSCASIASKDGYNYVLVLFGAEKGEDGLQPDFVETKKIYNWVFTTFKVKTVMDKGETITEVPLRLASEKKDHLKLMSGEMLTALIPDDIDVTSITMSLKVPTAVNAPVNRGDKIGIATFTLAGKEVGSVDLLAAENIKVSTTKEYIDKAVGITKTFWFKFILIFIILISISYSVIAIYYNKQKKKYSSRR